MSININASDADETNVNQLWTLQRRRTVHLKSLYEIYQQKQTIKPKLEKQHILRQKKLQLYQLSKLKDFNNRNKNRQDKINYENSLLRNKILEVYEKKSYKSRRQSLMANSSEKIIPFNVTSANQIYQSNLKIGQRLTSIKSQSIQSKKLRKHAKKCQILLQMISKKSPKKRAYLESLTKYKVHSPFKEDQYLNEK